MFNKRLAYFIGILAISSTAFLLGKPLVAAEAPASVEETIMSRLHQARPDIQFTSVSPSPIAGLYQVHVVGGPILYVTPEADMFITGEIFSVKASGFAKYEDPGLIVERKKLLSSVNAKDAIIFKAKGKAKAAVYVFTDVDCGYCRKLNSQMNTYTEEGQQKPGYSDLGIEIRYLAYPRAGVASASADKLVTAWCSNDKQKTLTMLNEDQPVPNKTCNNPIAAQFELGGKLGVNGTPAIWMPNGELRPGYLPPDQLAKELGIL